MDRKFNFGDEVMDSITGFKGIVIGYCDYITGCSQYLIQPKSEKESEIKLAKWFDDMRLELTNKNVVEIKKIENGCDMPAPMV